MTATSDVSPFSGRSAVIGLCTSLTRDLLEYDAGLWITYYLHGQVGTFAFYENIGFFTGGPVFDEAGISHRRMVR